MEITGISAVEGGRVRWPQPVAPVQAVRPAVDDAGRGPDQARERAVDAALQQAADRAAARTAQPPDRGLEVGPRPVMVPQLASEISAERARGELQPWQEISGQYLLVLASRFTAGDPTPVPDRLLEASLRYVADGGAAG